MRGGRYVQRKRTNHPTDPQSLSQNTKQRPRQRPVILTADTTKKNFNRNNLQKIIANYNQACNAVRVVETKILKSQQKLVVCKRKDAARLTRVTESKHSNPSNRSRAEIKSI